MAFSVVPHLRQQGWGRIINVSKSRDSMHRPLNSPYGPTKAALETMTLAWAQDLPDTGVTVNSLSPGGSVDTAFVLPAVRARATETGKNTFQQKSLFQPQSGSPPNNRIILRVAVMLAVNGRTIYRPTPPPKQPANPPSSCHPNGTACLPCRGRYPPHELRRNPPGQRPVRFREIIFRLHFFKAGGTRVKIASPSPST